MLNTIIFVLIVVAAAVLISKLNKSDLPVNTPVEPVEPIETPPAPSSPIDQRRETMVQNWSDIPQKSTKKKKNR